MKQEEKRRASSGSKIIIAGGTGFLGMNLARHLTKEGCEVVLVSRNPPKERGAWRHATWDGRTVGDWAKELEGAAGLVNLAGRTVDCINSSDHRDEILRSRVEATLALGAALQEVKNRPTVWVQMSTAHIYGDPPELVCDEDSVPGRCGLAPEVGKAWEQAYTDSVPDDVRQVVFRTSFVLGRTNGAFPKMKLLARLGLGGRVASGRQGISWIHETDMTRLLALGLKDESMTGLYLATAPDPVSQATFMKTLRRAIGIPFGLPASEWMVRFGAYFLLRTNPELILYGRYCVSRRLEQQGFAFRFPKIEPALADLCR